MKITQSTAMSIVTEMKKIIGEDLTFMDTTCHIIACTDPTRVGDYHGGSERMLRPGSHPPDPWSSIPEAPAAAM